MSTATKKAFFDRHYEITLENKCFSKKDSTNALKTSVLKNAISRNALKQVVFQCPNPKKTEKRGENGLFVAPKRALGRGQVVVFGD